MKNEDYQEFEGHVYLDIFNPLVAWNVSRGGFVSADVLGANDVLSQNSLPLSPWAESLFRGKNKLKREIEFSLEALRRKNFPKKVSRLSGIFLFGGVEDAAAIWDQNRWGGHFEDANLADCGVQARAVSRLDANWIDQMISGEKKLASDWREMAISYWNGCPMPDKEPVWETIASGGVTIWGTDFKKRGCPS